MELTRRSAFKLIGGAVMSFGPLRLAAPGQVLRPEWLSVNWSGLQPLGDTRCFGRLTAQRSDGQCFYVAVIIYREHYSGYNMEEINALLQSYDPGWDMGNARMTLDTFLHPGCYCRSTPKLVCPEHQEMFNRHEDGTFRFDEDYRD